MWQDKILIWQSTDHSWDDFGEKTQIDDSDDDDPLYAKVLTTWKKIELVDFIKRILVAASSAYKFNEEPSITTSFALVVAALNLFPLDIKYVKEDELAKKFLELIHETDDGDEYFLQQELNQYIEIKPLIDYFTAKNLLKRTGDKIIIQGKVLNRSHLIQRR